jgi:S1-C subfamily serine protease
MSDRFDDLASDRVPGSGDVPHDTPSGAASPLSSNPAPVQSPFSWAVAPDGQPEPVGVPPTTPPSGPTWPGTATQVDERSWSPSPSDAYGSTQAVPVSPGPPNGGSDHGAERQGRGWFLVAVVAALIGAGVGAGVTALTEHNGNSNGSTITTIKEGDATPGAAISGGANIPKLVDLLLPAVVSIDVKTPQEEDEGTGMIISANGMVVTNYHVIALAAEEGGTLTVTESGSTSAQKATLIGTDQTDDVALLRIDGATNLKTIIFGDSDKAVVGDAVVAIGNALGLAQGTPTVTSGIVSALGRTVTAGDNQSDTETLSDLIQTDAAINPGNSGGPLVDSAGEVIGMNTAVAGSTGDGTDAQNIGFAIPSAQIESLIPTLEKGNAAVRSPGYIGVDIATLTPQLRAQYGLTPATGAVIINVLAGGPAAQAGLAQDDVIVGIGAKPVTSYADLEAAVQSYKAGDTITVVYYRGNRKRTVSVTLISQTQVQNLENQDSGSLGGSLGGGLGGGLSP